MALSIDLFKSQLDSMFDALDVEMIDWRRYQAVQAAVERYGIDSPDFYTEDVTGDGGRYYAMSNFTYWIEGFSGILSIEYPAATIASDETPIYLEREDWEDDYWAEVSTVHTRHLYLRAHAPAATETMRIKYTVPYVWAATGSATAVAQTGHGFSADDFIYKDSDGNWQKTADNTTKQAHAQAITITDADNFTYKVLSTDIPQQDFFAVCNLAACIACQWMAAKYAKATDTTIGADSTTHTSRTAEFSNRSQEFCKKYSEHMGFDQEKKVHAAGEFVDYDTYPSHRSRGGWLFHND